MTILNLNPLNKANVHYTMLKSSIDSGDDRSCAVEGNLVHALGHEEYVPSHHPLRENKEGPPDVASKVNTT